MKTDPIQEIVEPILHWYELNKRELPWRKDANPYHIWVSEIMLQQTRIEAVIPYYERFIDRLPDIRSLAKCSDEELHKLWEGLGYYSRVRNMKKAAITIMEEHKGNFPQDYASIRALSGIGDYTAGAISSMAYGLQKAAVDGNVMRVISRVLANPTDNLQAAYRKEITQRLEACYPTLNAGSFTQGIMELGEVLCIPNGKALCAQCPISHLCQAYRTNCVEQYPVRSTKKERKKETLDVFRIECGDKILLHCRPKTGLLADMWEYPNLSSSLATAKEDSERCIESVVTLLGMKDKAAVKSARLMGTRKHIFTHIEWEMHCYEIELEAGAIGLWEEGNNSEYAWVSKDELRTVYALPTAFKKCFP